MQGVAVLVHIIHGHGGGHRHGRGRDGHRRLRGNVQTDHAGRLIIAVKARDFQICAAKISRIGIKKLGKRRARGRRKRCVLHVRVADLKRGVSGKCAAGHVQPVAAVIAGLVYRNRKRLHGRFAFRPGKGEHEGRLLICGQRGERHMAQKHQHGKQKAHELAQGERGIGHKRRLLWSFVGRYENYVSIILRNCIFVNESRLLIDVKEGISRCA